MPTWYQTEGIAGPRCGSLASRALPVLDCSGATAHELEPMPSPTGPIRAARSASIRDRPVSAGSTASSASAVARARGDIPDRAADPCTDSRERLLRHLDAVLHCRVRAGGPRAGRSRPAGRRRSLVVEHAVNDGPLVHDLGVLGERVVRVELQRPRAAHRRGVLDPVHLVVGVAAQVPGDGLAPREGVDRGPRLDRATAAGQAKHQVLQAELGRAPVGDVGVHPVRVGLQHLLALRAGRAPLLLGHPAPPHRAQVLVGVQLALADQLGDAAPR